MLGLQRLGFSAGTVRAFGGSFEPDVGRGRYVFPPMHPVGLPCGDGEILYLDGNRFVPSGFFWVFRPDGDCPVSRVFLFSSASDAMAAYEIKKRRFFGNSLIFAVGPNPSYSLVAALKRSYPASGFRLCFPDDPMGRILDVKVGVFLSGREISAELDGGNVVFAFGGKKVSLHRSGVSLARFEKISGCHLGARTLKAKGFRTFLDRLKAAAGQDGTPSFFRTATPWTSGKRMPLQSRMRGQPAARRPKLPPYRRISKR